MPDDPSEPPPEELEMACEEMTGQPFAGPPEERVRALEKRIAYLQDQLTKSEATDEPLRSGLIRLTNADLLEARRQLADWKCQHDGRN